MEYEPIGLVNGGNLCYLNSALQVLYSIEPLRKYLLNGAYKDAINKTNKMGTQGKMIETIANFFNMYKNNKVDLNDILKMTQNMFPLGDQQDSHEVLMYLIDGIHEDINTNGSFVSGLFYGKIQGSITCLSCGEKSTTTSQIGGLSLDIPKWSEIVCDVNKMSLMKNVLVGVKGICDGRTHGSEVFVSMNHVMKKDEIVQKLSEQLKIDVSNIKTIYVTNNSLRRQVFDGEIVRFQNATIEVVGDIEQMKIFSDKTKSVTDALKQYFTGEQMDEWKCEKCGKRGGTKTAEMVQLPQYLILNIKLFEQTYYGYSKKSDNLSFPEEFEWGSIVGSTTTCTYKAVATINHVGYTFFGHYYSLVRVSNQWYCCNDTSISKMNNGDIHRKDVYVVVYQKCEN
ncbi:hypothetical protein EIN_410950 [Entamoeba invadens IP1]|uniref:USP domain-containing protein n=2 Tax=Entamoeba invadens TaxID=33085 RepID=A0A0A1U121_ENTIV|nr:hypothetical protein EIN_410950 [Entamoeba invadens IP1]ELP87742.1 hypothetical protein EIN_410950 [Entamoeba invadens IP1]BAN40833.1 hypothetical protein [Entamoeba invadens]|eukprot:XP_004254513.1 hypothetical protein EIN_410950 [Entamoeba invadens IP1]